MKHFTPEDLIGKVVLITTRYRNGRYIPALPYPGVKKVVEETFEAHVTSAEMRWDARRNEPFIYFGFTPHDVMHGAWGYHRLYDRPREFDITVTVKGTHVAQAYRHWTPGPRDTSYTNM